MLVHSSEVVLLMWDRFPRSRGGWGPPLNHRDRGPLVGPQVRGAVGRRSVAEPQGPWSTCSGAVRWMLAVVRIVLRMRGVQRWWEFGGQKAGVVDGGLRVS